MKRKYIILLIVAMTITLFFSVFKSFRLSLFSVISSSVTPVDYEYIINEAEWLSNSKGGIIRFDNGDSQIKNDTIYYFGEPRFIVTKLNKYFNEMTVKDLKTNEEIVYTSTREFMK
jgi:hypothetical protein